MLGTSFFAIDAKRTGDRIAIFGTIAITLILAVGAVVLFATLPDANAFNDRVERLFIENDNLTSGADIKLLEILAGSGTSFAEVLASYRGIIFVLTILSVGLLVTSLAFLMTIVTLNRRMGEIERAGIRVSSLMIGREERTVYLNDIGFKLTEGAIETLSVLAEARMDEEFLTGSQIEAMISGKPEPDCDEASGATRIKRLRDSLGNQIVSELLIKNISRKGYVLAIDKNAIDMI